MRYLLIVAALFTVSCGGGEGGSPMAPTPQIPNVVGNYVGSTTMSFPELQVSVTCTTTTTTTQSGSTVSIAPFVLAGQCGNTSIPIGQVTIDNTGAIQGQNTSTYSDPSCGVYNVTGSGGFFGRELRFSVVATSATCYNFNMTVTLTR